MFKRWQEYVPSLSKKPSPEEMRAKELLALPYHKWKNYCETHGLELTVDAKPHEPIIHVRGSAPGSPEILAHTLKETDVPPGFRHSVSFLPSPVLTPGRAGDPKDYIAARLLPWSQFFAEKHAEVAERYKQHYLQVCIKNNELIPSAERLNSLSIVANPRVGYFQSSDPTRKNAPYIVRSEDAGRRLNEIIRSQVIIATTLSSPDAVQHFEMACGPRSILQETTELIPGERWIIPGDPIVLQALDEASDGVIREIARQHHEIMRLIDRWDDEYGVQSSIPKRAPTQGTYR